MTDEQAQYLEEIAHKQGVSKSQVVRDAIERERQQSSPFEQNWDRDLDLAGKFKSGTSHVSKQHDDELANIYAK